MTWSVGFRSPTAQEIVGQFLDYLQDHLQMEGIYSDPNLKRERHPGEIPTQLLDWVEASIRKAQWGREWGKSETADFLGRYLSESKAHIFVDPPARPLSPARFAKVVATNGLHMDPHSQLLFRGRHFFINGEKLDASPTLSTHLRKLANQRQLPPPPWKAHYWKYCMAGIERVS